MLDENNIEYEECIVANVIGPHYWGEAKEIKKGTKHFSPGAKVYCAFIFGGMGHEHVQVMGKPRKSSRMIKIVLAIKFLKNFRVQKVYQPKILAFLKEYEPAYNPHNLVLSIKQNGEPSAEITDEGV